MKLTTISLTYQRIFNMGNYSNIKPSITLSLDLDHDDDPVIAIQELTQLAQDHVHTLIDNELERDDQSPYFYDGPLYRLVRVEDIEMLIILPQFLELPGLWPQAAHIAASRRRYEVLLEKAISASYSLVDCHDGDLSRLPKLEAFHVFEHKGWLVIARPTVTYDDLPETWNTWNTTLRIYYGLRDSIADHVAAVLRIAPNRVLSVLDGDLDRILAIVPDDDLPVIPAIEWEPEDDDFLDDVDTEEGELDGQA